MTTHNSMLRAEEHYRALCKELGIDVSRPDTLDTPGRVVRMLADEFTAGLRPPNFIFTTFGADPSVANQLVNICGTRFVSICSHHHLPFHGLCHVCYLPNKRLAGASKIPRLIRWIAAQPSMQEDLTAKIRDAFVKELQPRFVGVRIIAEHTCMSCRGVAEQDAAMMTDAFWCTDESGKEGRPLDMADFETTKQEFKGAIDEWYKFRAR
jgi:GTP cyclohydrolase I